jgi:putative flavoprotein involved in K+ transport
MTAMPFPDQQLDVLVIGAGQAGLALGRHLQEQGLRFLLVDAGDRIGDVWRSRWDSLRLFTAAEYDGLPDLPFPAEPGTYPGKDDVADYLEAYAAALDLPVRLGTRVTRLARSENGWTAETTTGLLRARQVVVATGPFSVPVVPALAQGLADGVVQVHSAAYRRPADLPDGPVLVVGAGNSGVQIAEELAGTGRAVTLAVGTRPKAVPQRPLGRDLFWWLTRLGLIRASVDSQLGRRFRQRELVIGTTWRRLRRWGIELRPRLVGVNGSTARFADGSATDVAAVVWGTGFRADHGWIEVPDAFADGEPVHIRGVSPVPGLYFLGLPWQHTRGSALLGFVREDAAWLAGRLVVETAGVPVSVCCSPPRPMLHLG